MKTKFILSTLWFFLGLSAFSTEDRHPPINQKSINGEWEAISKRTIGVFRLEIDTEGKSFLSEAAPYMKPSIYEMTELIFTNEQVYMWFEAIDRESSITIKGTGVAGTDGDREEGFLNVELDKNPLGDKPNIWKLEFGKGWTISDLNQLAEQAKSSIDKEKKD